jgi:hypothetical protein
MYVSRYVTLGTYLSGYVPNQFGFGSNYSYF